MTDEEVKRLHQLELLAQPTSYFRDETVAWLCALARRLDGERDETVGIGPGMNDGPWTHCHDCSRRMVWEHSGEMPIWMCPRCVMSRFREMETFIARLESVFAERDVILANRAVTREDKKS